MENFISGMTVRNVSFDICDVVTNLFLTLLGPGRGESTTFFFGGRGRGDEGGYDTPWWCIVMSPNLLTFPNPILCFKLYGGWGDPRIGVPPKTNGWPIFGSGDDKKMQLLLMLLLPMEMIRKCSYC